MDTILNQIQTVRFQLQELQKNEATISGKSQRAAYLEARKLLIDLESETDVLTRVHFGLWENIALNTALRAGILSAIVNAEEPITAEQLATKCNTEPILTKRILTCLKSFQCIDSEQVEHDGSITEHFLPNKVALVHTSRRGILHMQWLTDVLLPGMVRVPQKLQDNGFQSLRTSTGTVFSDIHNKPESNLWQVLTPEEIGVCVQFMPTFNSEHVDWLEFYPVQERLIDASDKQDPEAYVFVDVGGNNGSQAIAFRQRFPDAKGKVVVQDLKQVRKGVEIEANVEFMVNDFFQPQPIKGARAYYLRHIMHDWSDDKNITILSHIRDAMDGSSKVLIHDWILPDANPSPLMTSMDLSMMMVLGGEERSLGRHEEYITAAGLKITGIWDLRDGMSEAIIECQKA